MFLCVLRYELRWRSWCINWRGLQISNHSGMENHLDFIQYHQCRRLVSSSFKWRQRSGRLQQSVVPLSHFVHKVRCLLLTGQSCSSTVICKKHHLSRWMARQYCIETGARPRGETGLVHDQSSWELTLNHLAPWQKRMAEKIAQTNSKVAHLFALVISWLGQP